MAEDSRHFRMVKFPPAGLAKPPGAEMLMGDSFWGDCNNRPKSTVSQSLKRPIPVTKSHNLWFDPFFKCAFIGLFEKS